ncbi:hypothetical protein RF11_12575 [Thelohanellus kitauei]|uniref:Uncharacterized protein n=1 Tax=Thelohanellus kitauei TaxID=669202 RepID=A0A0C2MJK2_THEKT|nr:hypothetical protein RF11_12575 [Thelohanellus kitauei]
MKHKQNEYRLKKSKSEILYETHIHLTGMKVYRVTITQINGSRFYGISEIIATRRSRGIIIHVNVYQQLKVMIDENICIIINNQLTDNEHYYGLANTPSLDTEDGKNYYLNFYVEDEIYYVIINQMEKSSHVFVTIDILSFEAFHLVVRMFEKNVSIFINEQYPKENGKNRPRNDYSSSDPQSDDSGTYVDWPTDESESFSIDLCSNN